MDDPVTDIAIVSDPDNCPKGYTVLTQCPCGHDAQLWEKVYGGAENTRYLCFTKGAVHSEEGDKEDDMVVESLYIPGSGTQYLMPGFKIISRTVEGDREPIRHKQLAVKKVPRDEATKVVADVVVAKEKLSKMYKRLEKINSVRICFRQADYHPHTHTRRATEPVTVDDLAMQAKDLSMSSHRVRTKSEFTGLKPNTPHFQSTLPSNNQIVEEMATVKIVETVASVPPTLSPPPTEEMTSPYSSQGPSHELIDSPVSPYPSPYPVDAGQTHENGSSGTGQVGTYPPPPSTTPPPTGAGASGYPPQSTANTVHGYTGSNTAGYPPPQPAGGYGYQPQAYPPPSTGGYPSYGTDPPRRYPTYPPQQTAPSTTVGYDTSIGFSFGGAGPTGGSYPPQPSQSGYPQYPSSSSTGQTQYGGPSNQYNQYPPATGTAPYPPPSNSGYGFNF